MARTFQEQIGCSRHSGHARERHGDPHRQRRLHERHNETRHRHSGCYRQSDFLDRKPRGRNLFAYCCLRRRYQLQREHVIGGLAHDQHIGAACGLCPRSQRLDAHDYKGSERHFDDDRDPSRIAHTLAGSIQQRTACLSTSYRGHGRGPMGKKRRGRLRSSPCRSAGRSGVRTNALHQQPLHSPPLREKYALLLNRQGQRRGLRQRPGGRGDGHRAGSGRCRRSSTAASTGFFAGRAAAS